MDSQQGEALFGRWLRKRRMGLDLTQKGLARRVGCSPATIRNLEAGERHPSRHPARGMAGDRELYGPYSQDRVPVVE